MPPGAFAVQRLCRLSGFARMTSMGATSSDAPKALRSSSRPASHIRVDEQGVLREFFVIQGFSTNV